MQTGIRIRRTRQFRGSRDTECPRMRSRLLKEIYDLTIDELLREITQLGDEQKIKILSQDIEQIEPRNDKEVKRLFLENLSKRIQQCFDYILKNPGVVPKKDIFKFLESIYLIFKMLDITISVKLFQTIWRVSTSTDDFTIFHKYASTLTSAMVYRSIRKFGKQFDSRLKQITSLLIKEVKILFQKLPQNPQNNIMITKNFNQKNEEQKLVIKFHLLRILDMLRKDKGSDSQKQKLQDQIKQLVKVKNCQILLQIITNFPKQCKKAHFMIMQELLGYTFDYEKKKLQTSKNILCQQMMTIQNIIKFLGVEDLTVKQINQKSFKQLNDQNKIYTKLNCEILEKILTNVVEKKSSFQTDTFQTVRNELVSLLNNKNCQIVFVEKGQQVTIDTVQFVCKIFQIYTKCLYLSREEQELERKEFENYYNDNFVNMIVKNFTSWSKDNQLKKKGFFFDAFGDFISFCCLYLHVTERNSTPIKKLLTNASLQIICEMGSIPNQWRVLKHARAVIQQLMASTQQQINNETVVKIVKMFLDTLFNEQFKFNRNSFYHFLRNSKPNQLYCQTFSDQVLKRVELFQKQLIEDKNWLTDEKIRLSKDLFIFKIHLLGLGSFVLSTSAQIAKILRRIYKDHAQHLKSLYYLRSWISFYYVEQDNKQIGQSVNLISSLIASSTIINSQVQNLNSLLYQQNMLSQTNENSQNKKIIQIAQAIQLLQNSLDLKVESIPLENETYRILIRQIIKPLSVFCYKVYEKTVLRCRQSEDKSNQLLDIIGKSIFKDYNSIYQMMFKCYKKLSLTIRIYLCNITQFINFEEARYLSSQVGNIFQELLVNNRINKSLQVTWRLLSLLFGQSSQKKINHFEIRQTLDGSAVKQAQKENLNGILDRQISLNIVIPLFSSLKKNLASLIANLTVQKRNRSKSERRFEHSCQNLLQGDKLNYIAYRKDFDSQQDFMVKEVSNNLKSLLSFILFPQITSNKIQHEKLALGFYLQQIKIILSSGICQDFIQDHIQEILNIFKTKRSKQERRRSFLFEQDPQQNKFKYPEPLDFHQYGIQPISHQQFKQNTKLLVKDFLDKFPDLIFKQSSEQLMKSLNSVVNFVKQISSSSSTVGQENQISVDYMIRKLLAKGQEEFHKYYQQYKQKQMPKKQVNLEQLKMVEKPNEMMQQQTKMENAQNSSEDEPSFEERIKKMLKQRNKNKNTRANSKLFVLFNILAYINQSKEALIKKCFQDGFQIELLEFLKIINPKETYEAKQILQFISITLPSIHGACSQQQIQEIVKYYRLILECLQDMQINNLNCIKPVCLKMIKEASKFKQSSYPGFGDQIVKRIKQLVMKCFQIKKMSRICLSSIINAIFMFNKGYLENLIQFNVKGYILKQFETSLFQNEDQKKKSQPSSQNFNISPQFIEFKLQKFIMFFSEEVQAYPEIFYKVTRSIIEGWKPHHRSLIYTKGIEQLCKFSSTKKSFVQLQVPQEIKYSLTKIVQRFCKFRVQGINDVKQKYQQTSSEQDEKKIFKINKQFYKKNRPLSRIIFNYMESLESILKFHKILIPFVAQIKVQNMKGQEVQFIDFIIEISIQEKIESMINFLTMFLNKGGLYLDYSSNITFSQYVSAKVLKKVIETLKSSQNQSIINQTIYFASVCLGFKDFNSLSMVPLKQKETSLENEVEKLLIKSQSEISMQNSESLAPLKLLYEECFYLICRHAQIERLKAKNMVSEPMFGKNYINSRLFLIQSKDRMRKFGDSDSQWQNSQPESEFLINEIFEQQQQNMNIDLIRKCKNYKKPMSWNSLDLLLSYFSKYLRVEPRMNQQAIQLNNLKSQADNLPINAKIISSYFKSPQQAPKKLSRRSARFKLEMKREKINSMAQFKEIQGLSQYYQHLLRLIPESIYKIPKGQAKFIDIQQEKNQVQNFQTLRQSLQDLQQHNQQRDMMRRLQPQSQQVNSRITDKQFYSILQSIQPNSEAIMQQESPTKNKNGKKTQIKDEGDYEMLEIPLVFKISRTQSIKQQIYNEQETKLRQNQNYRKLDDMSYLERVQFLINEADDKFFNNLPTEIDITIREQAQVHRRQRQRTLYLKRRSMENESYGRRRWRAKKSQNIKIQQLNGQQSLKLSEKTIESILQCLYTKAIKKSSYFQKGSNQLSVGKGVNLLLQINSNNIKYKVLTTLLLMIKNIENIKIVYYENNDEKKWQKTERLLNFEEGKKKFTIEILKLIKFQLKQILFSNYELIKQPLPTTQYYAKVLPEIKQNSFSEELGCFENSYYPKYQLLSLALDYDHELAALIIKQCDQLPPSLMEKIFDMMKNQKINSKLWYQNLGKLSKNQALKRLFEKGFSKNSPPSFQLMGKILKYEFGQFPEFAKQLHMKAFSSYKSSYSEFIKEAFRLYQKKELISKKQQFADHNKILQQILEKMQYRDENIMQSPIKVILQLPQLSELFDFKTKRTLFKLKNSSNDQIGIYNPSSQISLLIDTNNVFASTYNQIMRLEPAEIRKGYISVKFAKGTSFGQGIFKPLVQYLFNEMFSIQRQMFIPVDNFNVYQPSKIAAISNPDYLNCFKFLGRILAICVLKNQIFPAFFTNNFYRTLLGKKPYWKDLQQVNQQMFLIIRGLKNSLELGPTQAQKIEDLCLTFVYQGKDMISQKIIYQLKPNGKNILVTKENAEQFIELAKKQAVLDFCQKQYESIKEGFYQLIPLQSLQIFNFKDLEKLISGIQEIDRKKFQMKCQYNPPQLKNSQEALWFWKYVNECNNQQLASLVQFFRGMRKLPAGGFENINVSMSKLPEINTSPNAALCGGISIKLPKYTSYEKMVEKIKEAIIISEKGQGFMER